MRFAWFISLLAFIGTVAPVSPAVGVRNLGVRAPRVALREFMVPLKGHSWGLYGIANGPDKAIWFTAISGNGKGTLYASAIGRTSADGKSRVYYLTPSAGPQEITTGSDGALWFTEYSGGKIGRITTTGSVEEFALPNALDQPLSITSGPDGALWFTAGESIGRITTGGVVSQYDCSVKVCNPYEITVGPDGALWSTDGDAGLDRFSEASGSRLVARVAALSGFPAGITTGPDGALWFCEAVAGQIARYEIGGGIREYKISGGQKSPNGITVGPDNALWFTLAGFGIGRIDTAGKIQQYATPSGDPYEIVTGADGALWFTDPNGAMIGRAALR